MADDRARARHLRRRAAAAAGAGIAALALSLVITGCGGGDSSSTTGSTNLDSSSSTPPVTVPAYCDPAVPVSVALGQQFALALDADPASGSSWTAVAPPDPNVILSIGTEFPSAGTAVQGSTCANAGQILRYGGRGLGTATITLRYGRPGAAATPQDKTLVFTVTVVDPNAPTTAPPATTAPTTAPPTTAAPPTTRGRTTTTTARARTTTTT